MGSKEEFSEIQIKERNFKIIYMDFLCVCPVSSCVNKRRQTFICLEFVLGTSGLIDVGDSFLRQFARISVLHFCQAAVLYLQR